MKKYKQLTSEQRYTIYLGVKSGEKKTEIASKIGVNVSTIYRELNRNKNKSGGPDVSILVRQSQVKVVHKFHNLLAQLCSYSNFFICYLIKHSCICYFLALNNKSSNRMTS